MVNLLKNSLLKGAFLPCLAGVFLISAGCILGFPYVKSILGSHELPSPETVITTSLDRPSEDSVSESLSYNVAANLPRRILIPSLTKTGFIQQVSNDQAGRIASPTNIHLAGWYVKSEKPGDPGLSIIGGHISGAFNDGIFIRLSTMKVGDIFSIEYGDMSTRSFKVKQVRAVSLEEANTALFDHDESLVAQLNLITCDGPYDAKKQTYSDRVIVVSERI
jgi:LPXTG-site transpeptidase (sortase) family protein